MTAQLDAPVLDFAARRGVRRARSRATRPRRTTRSWSTWATGSASGRRWPSVDGRHQPPSSPSAPAWPERYVQEWLSAQAAAGYVTYDAATETFTLSAEAAAVLAEEMSPAVRRRRLRADRRGLGRGRQARQRVHDRRGRRLARARPSASSAAWRGSTATMYRASLLTEWFPAVPGLVERLESGIRVARRRVRARRRPTILLAEAFPNSTFVGVDYHEESIRLAKAAAVEAGVTDRVHFHESRRRRRTTGSYDLVLLLRRRPRHGRPGRRTGPRTGRARGRAARWSRSSRTPRTPSRPTCRNPIAGVVLRRQLGAVRPAQHQRGRYGAGRAGRVRPGCSTTFGDGRLRATPASPSPRPTTW